MTAREPILEALPLDESAWVEVSQFCAWLRVEPQWIEGLVEVGVLEPRGATPAGWSFPASDLARVRTVARLARELDLEPAAAALVADLLVERRRLERRIALLERLLQD
jgi:chaperone modulatory protein CbpM